MEDNRKFSIEELVMKLIGSVSAYGETNHDEKALKNLKELDKLLYTLIIKVIDNIPYKNRVEYSMKKIGEMSQNIIDEIYQMAKDYQEPKDNSTSAREMFEQLGFEYRRENESRIIYKKDFGDCITEVVFYDDGTFYNNLIREGKQVDGSCSIYPELLKAIIRQCNESGWEIEEQ